MDEANQSNNTTITNDITQDLTQDATQNTLDLDEEHSSIVEFKNSIHELASTYLGSDYMDLLSEEMGTGSAEELVKATILRLKDSGKTPEEIYKYFETEAENSKSHAEIKRVIKKRRAEKKEKSYEEKLKEEFKDSKDIVLQKAEEYLQATLGISVNDYLKGLDPEEKTERLKSLKSKHLVIGSIPTIPAAAAGKKAEGSTSASFSPAELRGLLKCFD